MWTAYRYTGDGTSAAEEEDTFDPHGNRRYSSAATIFHEIRQLPYFVIVARGAAAMTQHSHVPLLAKNRAI